MPHILSIETATTVCSVCVSAGEKVLAFKEVNSGYTHAENLHVFIQEVMKETGLSFSQLDAVAVSKGPGSYTGLRIGVSTAKGLCYGQDIPLIAIDTLESMAFAVASQKKEDALYCPMLDARRMEVYCAVYDQHGKNVIPVNALILDESSIQPFAKDKPVYFFGDGMDKARPLLSTLKGVIFIENVFPSAKNMVTLAAEKFSRKTFENLAHFEPFYLKEFFTKHP